MPAIDLGVWHGVLAGAAGGPHHRLDGNRAVSFHTALRIPILHLSDDAVRRVHACGRRGFGSNGALYGTTTGGGAFSTGTIFELAPPVAASIVWTETVLYDTHDVGPAYTNFPQAPYAGLTIGKQGTL
jgi:uncharacterized repeat protein (TIGR03803 family)